MSIGPPKPLRNRLQSRDRKGAVEEGEISDRIRAVFGEYRELWEAAPRRYELEARCRKPRRCMMRPA